MSNRRFTHGGRVDNADRSSYVAGIDWPYLLHVTEHNGRTWTKGYHTSADADASARLVMECAAASVRVERSTYMSDDAYAQIERIARFLDETGRAQTPTGIRKDRATEDAILILWGLPGYGDACERAWIRTFEQA